MRRLFLPGFACLILAYADKSNGTPVDGPTNDTASQSSNDDTSADDTDMPGDDTGEDTATPSWVVLPDSCECGEKT